MKDGRTELERRGRAAGWGPGIARAASLCLLLAGGVASASGSAGAFDTAWGGTGIVLTPVPGGRLTAVAAHTDGTVAAAGFETTGATNANGQALTQWVVRRHLGTGALDTSFGSAGTIRLFGSYPVDQALDCAVDASGRVVVVGLRGVATNNRGGYATALSVVRLTASGSLDTTFGSAGVVTPAPATVTQWNGARVSLLADGRIVVGVAAVTQAKKGAAAMSGFGALRLLGTGAMDTAFSGDGFAFQPLSGTGAGFPSAGRTLGVQSDGGIVVGGKALDASSRPIWTLVRFHATGAADTSFGAVTGPVGDVLFSIRIDASDRIVAVGDRGAGASGTDTLVKRYLAGGSLDLLFGAGGQFLSGLPGVDYAADVAIQADGALVLALTLETATAGQYDFAPLRLLEGGLVDTGYGAGGIGSVTGLPSTGTWAQSIVITPGGDAVIGGRAPASPTAWATAAYLAN